MHRVSYALAGFLLLTHCAIGQTNKPKRITSGGHIVAQEVVLSGTSTLDSSQLSDIRNALSSVTMHDDDREVEERIRYEFQQRGYFDAEVTNVKVTPLDPLAKKKPVKIEAEVSEGPQFHLAELRFEGNKAFTADELRQMFPIHSGDVFNAEDIRLGLQTMREQYTSKGFLNLVPVPNTEKTSAMQITVNFDLEEGLQFRMGKLAFQGPADLAATLESNWQLPEGQPYDAMYLAKFVSTNREQLPESFDADRDVMVLEDCPAKEVNLTFWLDDKRPRTRQAQYKPCDEKDNKERQGNQ